MPLLESKNARSKSITTAEIDTFGVLNRHAIKNTSFQVGISEDMGHRRTMEDAHSFVFDYDSIRGQGFFAVFDGHAGKDAAEWCGMHFHEYLLETMHARPEQSIPDILNLTFHAVDNKLSRMSDESEGKIHSGTTAVTAFLRIEDAESRQSFLKDAQISPADSPVSSHNHSRVQSQIDGTITPSSSSDSIDVDGQESPKDKENIADVKKHKKEKKSRNPIKKALKTLSSSTSASSPSVSSQPSIQSIRKQESRIIVPPAGTRRVLYSANAGDARGVLCRGGKSVRLTYDHKGSDKQEAKRITDAGGFVMSGRVNGVLAVTRALGDSSMKEFVVGAPYTTETELCDEDEFLILACDGLWDVITDQEAVDLVRDIEDAQDASNKLVKWALSHRTQDNITVLVIRFKHNNPPSA